MNQILEKHRNRDKDESGVALIIAVLIFLVLAALITFMTSYALRSIEKGSSVQNLNTSLNAADTAVANMFSVANGAKNANGKELDKYLGPTKAVKGNFTANEIDPKNGDGKYGWEWYAEKTASASSGTSYTITAKGYPLPRLDPSDMELKEAANHADARTVKVVITSSTVEEIQYQPNGSVTYVATRGGTFAYPAFAEQSVELSNNATVNVYDSSTTGSVYPTASLYPGEVATNNSLIVGSGTNLKQAYFYGSSSSQSKDQLMTRCSGVGCTGLGSIQLSYAMSLAKSRADALAACPNASYPDWVASQNLGTIAFSTTPKCYNNIIFDVDTSLPGVWSTGNPAIMYAKASITVQPGVEVAKQKDSSQGPLALQLISSGSGRFVMDRGSLSDRTILTGVVTGLGLVCDIGGNSGINDHGTTLYGSVACAQVKIQPKSTIWWDRQLDKSVKVGSMNAKRIWSASSYEEM